MPVYEIKPYYGADKIKVVNRNTLLPIAQDPGDPDPTHNVPRESGDD